MSKQPAPENPKPEATVTAVVEEAVVDAFPSVVRVAGLERKRS